MGPSLVWSEKKKIYHMLQVLILKSRMLYKQHTNDSITRFIQQRCQDYQDNPKAMLDSLLNRSKHVIHLDRLVVKDHHNDPILITDPDTIKQATVHHFQNVAGSLHMPKDQTFEWTQWLPEYAPRDYIDSLIYNQFLNLLSLPEWLEIIHQLLNHKALGPS